MVHDPCWNTAEPLHEPAWFGTLDAVCSTRASFLMVAPRNGIVRLIEIRQWKLDAPSQSDLNPDSRFDDCLKAGSKVRALEDLAWRDASEMAKLSGP